MRISDWSSDVCSSDLGRTAGNPRPRPWARDTAPSSEWVRTSRRDVAGFAGRLQWAGKWLVKSQAFAPRLYRHSVLAACKWQLSELPVLTDLVSAALRVSENHHFRLAIPLMSIQPRDRKSQSSNSRQ